jgi:cleavage and polyadenylation specificity factor subunit 1
MYDDDTGAEPKIISASFADPFILLLRDDSSIFVAQCDDNNELEEVEREDDALLSTNWLTGCLYIDSTGIFASVQSDKGHKAGENVMIFLLSAGGALHVSGVWRFTKFNANAVRYMLCLISRKLSTLQKVYVSCRLFYQQITQLGDRQLVKPSQRYWSLISATLSLNLLTSL